MADPYVNRKTVNASYRPKSNQMSEGLKRARQPFFLRNAVTGVVLGAFVVGVWAYSIRAVKQDDFTDVDEEARALARSGASAVQGAVSEVEQKAAESTQRSAPGTGVTVMPIEPGVVAAVPVESTPPTKAVPPPRGVLASLLHTRYPRSLDPSTRTLIWGAPSVDRIGRWGDTPFSKSQ
ncbi:hypothetical protein PHLGIDRAFT_129432 [Phlebiopsis gigantea 11061_1 CR5-6]|uniref:Cytochrome c oxidase assembly factor 3 n=1 Tax=Phlebiopsis gigantea (strain 11061_1 CR5-6) TaxID=745531 RepID=A0A0C3S790_PHLG1|nr:hypothetical protein PHLGIDRAFT_129432 [Phlebiopsis gigantea 11061_1 CR5-6]